jgi:hypothetical protein
MSHVDELERMFLFLLLAEGIGAPHGPILVSAGVSKWGSIRKSWVRPWQELTLKGVQLFE